MVALGNLGRNTDLDQNPALPTQLKKFVQNSTKQLGWGFALLFNSGVKRDKAETDACDLMKRRTADITAHSLKYRLSN